MFQHFKLDARKVNSKTKKAVLLEDLLGDEEKKNIGAQEEKSDVPKPEGEKLTPVKPLPGAPKGLQGEVEEDYTPMSAEEIAEKRKEHEKVAPAPPAGEGVESEEGEATSPPAFLDIMQNLLKEETPEGKKEQAQQTKYGPPEKIQETVDTLKEFYGQKLMDVDIETAQAIMTRADLPDILKERAKMLFDSRTQGDMIRAEQMALGLMKATSPKQQTDAEEWLRNTPDGQKYMNKIFDRYRIGRVMSMLENTVLMMAGQRVIDQPRREPGASPGQRTEKTRLNELGTALQEGTITNNDFDDAKRKGWTLSQLMQEKKNRGTAFRLNMRKNAEGDSTGPGGDSWEYEWTAGPTPTKDEPQKRKHRFPFHNKPSGYTPGEGDQGNLFDVGPQGGQSDMNYLASVIDSMNKTADNDMFSTYALDNGEKWLTYTLFKKAYSKFRPGDIIVQHGKTATDCCTYRRRFGSVAKAKKLLVAALSPILAAVVGNPTPDDTLHDLQKGKGEPGGAYGPRTGPYDKQPWQGNRDGFDAKNTPRQRTKRKFIPHMDQPDDEGSGFMGGSTMGRKYRNAPQVSQMTLPELLEAHKPDGMFGTVWGEPCKVRFEELTGEKWHPETVKNIKAKKADFNAAAPVVETPEDRAAVIEQPAVKPINRDPKRPFTPKKRYDLNEQQLTNSPNYMGEDSSGFDKERIRLSMKKDV